jgi:hypothetical protein
MVTGRTTQPVGAAFAAHHRRGCVERDVDGRAGGVEGALGDRRRRLEAPAAEFVIDQRIGRERSDAVEESGHGEHVRHDVVGAGMADLVVTPGAAQEVDESRIVDRRDRCGPPVVGLDEFEPLVGGERVVDRIRSTGVLERRLQPRRLDLGQRSVTAMAVGRDDAHRSEHPGTP